MEAPNLKITEGCLVLVVKADKKMGNIGKMATAVKRIFAGELVKFCGKTCQFEPDCNPDHEECWVIEGEGIEASVPRGGVFGVCIAKASSLLPIYPEDDEQHLESSVKEYHSCAG